MMVEMLWWGEARELLQLRRKLAGVPNHPPHSFIYHVPKLDPIFKGYDQLPSRHLELLPFVPNSQHHNTQQCHQTLVSPPPEEAERLDTFSEISPISSHAIGIMARL